MPKLICGLRKQVVELDGSTRSASVNLEIELEPATVRDAPKLKQHIRCGFDRIRQAIDEELARGESNAVDTPSRVPKTRRNGRSRPLPLR